MSTDEYTPPRLHVIWYPLFFMRAELRRDTPPHVLRILSYIVGEITSAPDSPPDHPLFDCKRWQWLGTCSSAYFPAGARSSLSTADQWSGPVLVMFANLKNYDDEIAKFFDWIDPYLCTPPGGFVGYSLFEYDTTPVIYHKAAGGNTQ